jgi:hypothetical protein
MGKLLPPHNVSTVAKNVWESRGRARQLNWTVLITGVYIEPTIYALQTYFLPEPRVLPYKPQYKAIPSFALEYLQKIKCSYYRCMYKTQNICFADYFLTDPRILPYKPVYKAIPSLALGYWQKINSENSEHETKIIKLLRESTKAFNGILSVKEKRYRTTYYLVFTRKCHVSVALLGNAVWPRL